MNNISKIIGCSFDGFSDQFASSVIDQNKDTDYFSSPFRLSTVILPERIGNRYILGKEAHSLRNSSGLQWSPQARVNRNQYIKRVPLSLLWKLLIDNPYKNLKWSSKRGTSIALTRILAAHIKHSIRTIYSQEDSIILAIPNELSDFSQQNIINDLVSHKIGSLKKKPKLIWRPVAAALSWLDKVQNELPPRLGKNDFIIVIHLGPESFEIVPFRLKEKVFKGKRYVVPQRDVPKKELITSICGWDWCEDIVSRCFMEIDDGAYWQAIVKFPEVWNLLINQEWEKDALPRIWSHQDYWGKWIPNIIDLSRVAKNSPARTVRRIVEIVNLSIQGIQPSRGFPDLKDENWIDYLAGKILSALGVYQGKGKLYGIILSGPIGLGIDETIQRNKSSLIESGLLDYSLNKQPTVGGIWNPPLEFSAVADGSCIYGKRLAKGEPTYFDTLEQIYFYARKGYGYKWCSLLLEEDSAAALKEQEEIVIEGGQPYKPGPIKGKFLLSKETEQVKIYLSLKDRAPPYGQKNIKFPYPPEKDLRLDVHVKASPASGLYVIELVPEEKKFLQGRAIRVNYWKMDEIGKDELPPEINPLSLAPPVRSNRVDPKDYFLVIDPWEVNQYLKAKINDKDYEATLDDLIQRFSRRMLAKFDGVKKNVRFVNKNGEVSSKEGNEVIRDIRRKIHDDLETLMTLPIAPPWKFTSKFLRISSWLYGAAPSNAIGILKKKVHDDLKNYNLDYIDFAARCFTDCEGIKLIVRAVVRRIAGVKDGIVVKTLLPVKAYRGLWRLLRLRGNAHEFITKKQANIILKSILFNIKTEHNKNTYKIKFFRNVFLFLYFLRNRLSKPGFLAPGSSQYERVYSELFECLEAAKLYLQKKGFIKKFNKVELAVKRIKEYMKCKGSLDPTVPEELDDTLTDLTE